LFLLKSNSLKEETVSQITSLNPVNVRILKRQTDWKNDIKQDVEIFSEDKWYPAVLYGDIRSAMLRDPKDETSDILDENDRFTRTSDHSLKQTFLLHNPRINCRMFKDSYRITVSIMDKSYIGEISHQPFSLEYYLENIREIIRSILLNNNELRSGFIACGLFLGEKQMIPDPIQKRINGSGISHLFAVSGLHVGFIVLLFTLLLKHLGIGIRSQMILICLFSFFYAFLTPFSSSVFRTVLMLLLYSISRMFNRKIHVLHIVFLSALIMLILNPHQISQVGFWFSYLAVLGILIFFPVLSQKVHSKNRFVCYISDMVLVSCSATWGIIPAGMLVFGTVSTLAIFLNIIMIPLVFLMLGTIIMKVIFSVIPFLGQCVSWIYSGLSAVFFYLLETVYPYSEYLVYTIRGIPLTGVFWLTGTLLFFNIPRKRIHKIFLYTGIILIACSVPGINRFTAISSEIDNSLYIMNRKNVLMVNGTGMNNFDNLVLKRFRLAGRKPTILIVTNVYHNDIKNIMTLQKRYPKMKIIVPESDKSIKTVGVFQDTVFSFGNIKISIFPKNNRLNVFLQKDECITGVLEYPPNMPAKLYLSRKKYSEIRSGTDKFLIARMIEDNEQMISILKSSNVKESFRIW